MTEHDFDKLRRLLDHRFGLEGSEQRKQTEELLENDAEAQQLDAALERMVRPLGAWQDEEPPAGLAERTVAFVEQHIQAAGDSGRGRAKADVEEPLVLAGHSEQAQYESPVRRVGNGDASERQGDGGRGRWVLGNFRDLIAVAASILIAVVVFQPVGRYAQDRNQRIACASQLGRIGKAFATYAGDNNGLLPRVNRQTGARWLMGQQGSNTRSVFLLVKRNYLPAAAFSCPARPRNVTITFTVDPNGVDFRQSEDITYSSRLIGSERQVRLSDMVGSPLVTDRNPLFEGGGYRDGVAVDLEAGDFGRRLRKANSRNHRGSGQNALYADGSGRFLKTRFTDESGDDIFTINSVTRYSGFELPDSDGDIFVAP